MDMLVPDAPWAPVRMSLLNGGQRRLEARTYLTDGYGIRQRLESTPGLTVPVAAIAEVWQPSRLKGVVVSQGAGLPFLSAGQVFEARPRVRKWLAEKLTPDAERRRVRMEWLLLSCSGDVGKLTAVYPEHIDKIITHDLLRIVPRDPADYGWIYAYMRTTSFRAIARSSQYGHMIKHLEPEHVQSMPIALPPEPIRREIGNRAQRAIKLRLEARTRQAEADELYAALVNPENIEIRGSLSQAVPLSDVSSGRRRLEGQYYRAEVRHIEALVRESASHGLERLDDLVESVALGNRFKRHFGPNGTPYRSAGELFDVNAPVTKRIYASLLTDPHPYMLRAGWIVMACSGQTYGLLGRTMVLTENHEGVFGSHDLIRIVPDGSVRTGYLQTVLNHAEYGRPLVVRYASGTSVPHLDPVDIRGVLIPRFGAEAEALIADLCEEGVRLSAEADRIETAAIEDAESLVEGMAGQRGSWAITLTE